MKDAAVWLDTICALATPPGIAGLAIVRVSGTNAIGICDGLFTGSGTVASFASHSVHVGWWGGSERRIDEVTVTAFKSPHSYTGEDVVEIGCHGGPFVIDQILSSLFEAGSRMAEPGEFTRRAFLNGKLDLLQVEAVADLIHSQTRIGAQTAARQLAGGFTKRLADVRTALVDACGLLEVELDFSEEGYEFVSRDRFSTLLKDSISLAERLAQSASSADILRSGFSCAVVGYPNAGKSSLFNALLDRSRAIVSDVPGTTRDYLEDSFVADGYKIGLYDTAGLRDTSDTVELLGIKLTSSVIEQSHLVLLVNDASSGFDHSDSLLESIRERFSNANVCVIQNKMDVVSSPLPAGRSADVTCSALTDGGVINVKSFIVNAAKQSDSGISDALVNQRQAALLNATVSHLQAAMESLQSRQPADLIAIDIRTAIRVLGELTGETWTPDVLDSVFSRFCIGK